MGRIDNREGSQYACVAQVRVRVRYHQASKGNLNLGLLAT
jgi:hypothetical protein